MDYTREHHKCIPKTFLCICMLLEILSNLFEITAWVLEKNISFNVSKRSYRIRPHYRKPVLFDNFAWALHIKNNQRHASAGENPARRRLESLLKLLNFTQATTNFLIGLWVSLTIDKSSDCWVVVLISTKTLTLVIKWLNPMWVQLGEVYFI